MKRVVPAVLCAMIAIGCNSSGDPDDKNSNVNAAVDTGNGSNVEPNANTPDVAGMDVDIPDGATGCVALGCPNELVCNTATGTCVDCVTNAECGPNGSCDPVSNKCACNVGFHACDGGCVPDDSVDACGTGCVPCLTVDGATTTCQGGQCIISCPDGLAFDETLMECVTCQQDADCNDPGASRCMDGACVPCTDISHCAGIADANFCDAGRCVECTALDESACGNNSCFAGACTTTQRGSVGVCEACRADSECQTGTACVPMQFAAIFRATGYCLPLDTGGCMTAPYSVAISRDTLSTGTTTAVCTINEDLTTCEALADYNSSCGDDSDCGDSTLDDGICEPVDFEFARCTSRCSDTSECPPQSLIGCATGDVNQMWCGAF